MMMDYYKDYCSRCPEDVHCCRNGFAFLTLDDAKKIKKNTKLEYREFIDYSPLDKKAIDGLRNEDPSLEGALRFSQLKKNRIMRLRKKNKNCIFLDEQGRCKIYEIRPNICRIYPFWAMRLLNGKIKIIEHDVSPKCGVLKGKDADTALTPKEKQEMKEVFMDIEKEKAGRVERVGKKKT